MIGSTSRYAANTIEVVTDENGESRRVIVPAAPEEIRARVVRYRWSDQDRVDSVAYEYYQDPAQWWRFADVNPEILDWTDVKPGTIVRIPYAD
ncbi:hypothetical protein GCM10010331_45130 [Streptomyces xanthochromogenes]|uniref:hypothetical protein n=1 Tax=Streptomyces xanthochromogenes TaxID=67384 RepID=UPI0016747428|nr:hypothetical protein [Streptomyces xanthochromogenes]GHB52487.1 hypothetical protein GCM10010331_45130 [Streptomyces xanthochromogenes]